MNKSSDINSKLDPNFPPKLNPFYLKKLGARGGGEEREGLWDVKLNLISHKTSFKGIGSGEP